MNDEKPRPPYDRYNEPFASVYAIADLFEHLGVAYALGGACARLAYGAHPRKVDATVFIAEMPDTLKDPFIEATQTRFHVEQTTPREIRLKRLSTLFDVRIRLARPPFETEMLARRQEHGLGRRRLVWVLSPEDAILSALFWYDRSGGAQIAYWDDAVDMLHTQGDTLDRAYLDAWAQRLGLRTLLHAAQDASV
nr:hypothetical protein [Ardenticatena sp.]